MSLATNNCLVATNNAPVYYWDVSAQGWTDWQTNTYIWSFSITCTNLVPRCGVLDSQGNPMTTAHLISSTNLLQWNPEIYCTTGWVSYQTMPGWITQPVEDWGNFLTLGLTNLANVLYVVYDSQGTPLLTNFSSGINLTNAADLTTVSGSASALPASLSVPHKFYRLATP